MKVKDLQRFAGLQDDDEVLVVRADGVGPILVPYSAIKKGPVSAVSADIPAPASDDPDIEALIQELVLAAHPVGSYYWSEKPTDPGALFGGSWTRIYGRFLYGRESNMSVGSTGGAKSVSLTTSTMPAHVHNDSITSVSIPSHNHTYGWTTHRHQLGSHLHTGSHQHRVAHRHLLKPHQHTSADWFGCGAEVTGFQGSYNGTRPGSPLVSLESATAFGYLNKGTGLLPVGYPANTSSGPGTGSLSYETLDGKPTSTSVNPKLGTATNYTISDVTLRNNSDRTSSTDYSFSVSYQGSGTAHENMPPYINAYCWRRTA